MSEVLLLFASREGQTEKVAKRIAEHLQNYGLTVLLINAAEKNAHQRLYLSRGLQLSTRLTKE